jgi:hypothetical protein
MGRFELVRDLYCFSPHPHNFFLISVQSTPVKFDQSVPNTVNMASPAFLLLCAFFLAANAAPLQLSQPIIPPTPTLSNEAILSLVGLFVAVLGITITLVASPKISRGLRSR